MFEPGHVTERKPPFRFAVYTRVAFSDTDAQGVVYYGRYLPYFDLARTEYHRQLGARSRRPGRVRRCAHRASSTTRPRGSTTCSRCSCASRGSARRASPTSTPRYRLDAGERGLADGDGEQTLVLIDHASRRTLAGAGHLPRPSLGVRGDSPLSALDAVEADPRRRRGCRRRPARGRHELVVEHGACAWAGILFTEDGELVLGPEAGTEPPAEPETGCPSSTTGAVSPSSSPTAARRRRSSSASRR